MASRVLKEFFSRSLLLPRTHLPMRANAAVREPAMQTKLTSDLYQWQLRSRPHATPWVLHDGPPYANGSLHIGHALNKVLKDVINRYKLLRGFRVQFVPGWDCHGLPIELKALQQLQAGGERDHESLGPVRVRQLARKFAEDAIAQQQLDFARWGVMADWTDPAAWYRTMDRDYEAAQLQVFGAMYKAGLIHRGHKPVYWSPSTRTALAEAELEYRDNHRSTAIHVGFPMQSLPSGQAAALAPLLPQLEMVIWTTTPWTIPANLALCVNQDLEYVAVRMEAGAGGASRHVIVATEQLAEFAAALGQPVDALHVVHRLHGRDLVGAVCAHPLARRTSPVLHGEHVTVGTGTGVVHTAPDHGMEDFAVCKQHGINELLAAVDDCGRYTEAARACGEELPGLNVLRGANDAVLELLKQSGRLLAAASYTHRYPYDWRSKQPVILRATQQWFASVSPLLPRASAAVKGEVTMHPTGSTARLLATLSGRTEWCISRQRAWGVPIPAFFDDETGECVLSDDTINHAAALVAEHGTDCWWTLPAQELLPPSLRASGRRYRPSRDTLDVWFDSGASWAAVLGTRGLSVPADLVLEGSDQHRGWFQSSLLTSVAVRDGAPYKAIVSHGFVLDEQGQKMSKSLGNVLGPNEIIQGSGSGGKFPAYGADVMRVWAASSDYSHDTLVGPTVLATVSDALRKVRNTARFAMGVLFDFPVAGPNVPLAHMLPSRPAAAGDAPLRGAPAHEHGWTDAVAYEDLRSLDRYMLHRISLFGREVTQAYDGYNFVRVYQSVNNFVSSSLSSLYFDALKDRLYADGASWSSRRAAQAVVHASLRALTLAVAPIACYTAEDVHAHLPHGAAHPESSVFHTTGWLDTPPHWRDDALGAQWDALLAIRERVNALLEQARAQRKLRTPADAQLVLHVLPIDAAQPPAVGLADKETEAAAADVAGALAALGPQQLAELCLVSQARIRGPCGQEAAHPDAALSHALTQEEEAAQPAFELEDSMEISIGLGPSRRVHLRLLPASGHKCPRCWQSSEPLSGPPPAQQLQVVSDAAQAFAQSGAAAVDAAALASCRVCSRCEAVLADARQVGQLGALFASK